MEVKIGISVGFSTTFHVSRLNDLGSILHGIGAEIVPKINTQ